MRHPDQLRGILIVDGRGGGGRRRRGRGRHAAQRGQREQQQRTHCGLQTQIRFHFEVPFFGAEEPLAPPGALESPASGPLLAWPEKNLLMRFSSTSADCVNEI